MANAPFGNHHCDIFHGEEQGTDPCERRYENCKLDHTGYMTVEEFLEKCQKEIHLKAKLNSADSMVEWRKIWDEIEKTALPAVHPDTEDMGRIKNFIDKTVRVKVTYTSMDRPDTCMNSKIPYACNTIRGSCRHIRHGTGFLYKQYNSNVKRSCTCPDCRESPRQLSNRTSYYFLIKTAAHVIFDQREAEQAVFEFFYDTQDRRDVKLVYGLAVLDSRHRRWETDTCFVVCVTHDDDLAGRLSHLCNNDMDNENVLVSHPHGVSKKISVGHRPRDTNIVISPCVKLDKGTKICFYECDDDTLVVEDINRHLDQQVIVFDKVEETFLLDCDLTIYRPEGVVVECVYHESLDYNPNGKAWWNVILSDTQLKTDDKNCYKFPNTMSGVTMKVNVKTKCIMDRNNKDKYNMFQCSRYNMASCKGSSGAHVYYCKSQRGRVHYGECGKYKQSSLVYVSEPKDEQEPKTYDIDEEMESDYKNDRQDDYDRMTQAKREYLTRKELREYFKKIIAKLPPPATSASTEETSSPSKTTSSTAPAPTTTTATTATCTTTTEELSSVMLPLIDEFPDIYKSWSQCITFDASDEWEGFLLIELRGESWKTMTPWDPKHECGKLLRKYHIKKGLKEFFEKIIETLPQPTKRESAEKTLSPLRTAISASPAISTATTTAATSTACPTTAEELKSVMNTLIDKKSSDIDYTRIRSISSKAFCQSTLVRWYGKERNKLKIQIWRRVVELFEEVFAAKPQPTKPTTKVSEEISPPPGTAHSTSGTSTTAPGTSTTASGTSTTASGTSTTTSGTSITIPGTSTTTSGTSTTTSAASTSETRTELVGFLRTIMEYVTRIDVKDCLRKLIATLPPASGLATTEETASPSKTTTSTSPVRITTTTSAATTSTASTTTAADLSSVMVPLIDEFPDIYKSWSQCLEMDESDEWEEFLSTKLRGMSWKTKSTWDVKNECREILMEYKAKKGWKELFEKMIETLPQPATTASTKETTSPLRTAFSASPATSTQTTTSAACPITAAELKSVMMPLIDDFSDINYIIPYWLFEDEITEHEIQINKWVDEIFEVIPTTPPPATSTTTTASEEVSSPPGTTSSTSPETTPITTTTLATSETSTTTSGTSITASGANTTTSGTSTTTSETSTTTSGANTTTSGANTTTSGANTTTSGTSTTTSAASTSETRTELVNVLRTIMSSLSKKSDDVSFLDLSDTSDESDESDEEDGWEWVNSSDESDKEDSSTNESATTEPAATEEILSSTSGMTTSTSPPTTIATTTIAMEETSSPTSGITNSTSSTTTATTRTTTALESTSETPDEPPSKRRKWNR